MQTDPEFSDPGPFRPRTFPTRKFLVCGQRKDAKPDDITCLKENGPVSEAKAAIVEFWDKNADDIGSVQNEMVEDDEQLFANELVVEENDTDSDDEVILNRVSKKKWIKKQTWKLDSIKISTLENKPLSWTSRNESSKN